jgi:hypothetical protein
MRGPMSEQKNNVSHREAESAAEVITQYDLNAGLQAEAMALVNERAGLAPFNPNISYMVAHTVCARLENPHA